MLRNSTSLKIGKKYESAISEVFKDSDGYWIYLNYGYISTETQCGTIHEYTLADLRKQLKTIRKIEDKDLCKYEYV